MAVTKILARRGGLAQAIAYVVNGDKTEEQVLTAAQGCSLGSACAEMQDAKIRWNKTDGVQLYHIIQSFRPGEITPGLALEIAQEFVREHLPGYQAVIGIHTDRDHIHAHIVFNSVNQLTGEKYHSNARSYYQQIRGISDRLCREHGLSVIMTGEPSKAVSYIEWLRQSKGQPTFRSMLEADLRTATQDANDLGHFFLLMEHMGYEIRHGDRLGFRLRGQERFMYPGRRDPLFTEDGMDAASPDEVATLTEEKLDILRQIFWDMNAISYWVETISGDEDESDTVILHITVTVKDHLQMADEYRFNAEQHKLLEELMQPEYEELFMRLTGSYQDIALGDKEAAEIMKKLPADLSEERKQVVLTAYQLLGKVNYFWGGKSLVLGWDSRWGTPMEVTAAGSSTTGTMRPFGLDCSGFVDWVFYNQSGGSYVIGHGGGASSQHSYCTDISWSDAQPGDLVFYPGDSHVGIVCGFDGNGNVLIIHCASGYNNVVVTGKSGFASIGRPTYYAD